MTELSGITDEILDPDMQYGTDIRQASSYKKSYQVEADGKPIDVLYCLQEKSDGRIIVWAEVTQGFFSNLYKNGQRCSPLPITDESVLNALRGLPHRVKKCIPELRKKKKCSTLVEVIEKDEEGNYREKHELSVQGKCTINVEYSVKTEESDNDDQEVSAWVAITNGESSKVYKNGKRISLGIPEIKNELILNALKRLPRYITNRIEELK